MPEHDEPCAHVNTTPNGWFCHDCLEELDPHAHWPQHTTRPDPGITERKPKSKRKRWGVEDKVVDGESK